MAVEEPRGCGYRKIGGLYLIGGGMDFECPNIPYELHNCPTCGLGYTQNRTWTWMTNPVGFFKTKDCKKCPVMADCPMKTEKQVGLMWVGKKHYPTPKEFAVECGEMGVSKRLPFIPGDLKLQETWTMFAHPEALGEGEESSPGIFYAFKPTKIEIIVPESFLDDTVKEYLEKIGVTPVAVPDDDPDHQSDTASTAKRLKKIKKNALKWKEMEDKKNIKIQQAEAELEELIGKGQAKL